MTTTNPTPDQGDERRAIHEWLMREHKIEVLGNPEDDTAAVISLGTLRNIARVAMSAAQPVAQEAINQIMQLVDDYGHVCAASVTAPSVDAGDTSKEYKAIESALTAAIAAAAPQKGEA